MAAAAVVNGAALDNPAPPVRQNAALQTPAKPPRKKVQKPNYAKIHSKPLPVEIYPLPAFIPNSPLSLLRIAATLLTHFFSPPSSHVSGPYIGYFSSETRSVHITNSVHVRALWEMGFFGKGTLSRSEPSWLDREKARLKAGAAGSAEEATRKRREERKLFKLERARAEREQIEQTLKQEKAAATPAGEMGDRGDSALSTLHSADTSPSGLTHVFPWQTNDIVEDVPTINTVLANDDAPDAAVPVPEEVLLLKDQIEPVAGKSSEIIASKTGKEDEASQPEEPIANQEHLQLTLEEAFFLTYGLGVLQVQDGPSSPSIKTTDLFKLSWRHSAFPPADQSQLRPDDPFMLNYAVYHYYRSLGWVVRPGVKFSADYMLYNRGPVFSHAEFAVIIIPEYAQDAPENEKKASRDWWWLHCVNRVQSQVRKSLVICYVEVPTMAALKAVGEGDIGAMLRQYKVREFVLRRFLANRSRD